MGYDGYSFCQGAMRAIEEAASGKSSFSFGNDLGEAARRIYAARRERSKFFPDVLMGEPGWDILLDLYIAHVDGRRLDVTSACIGAGVPSTTGLRWLAILEDQKLLERQRDKRDGRRWYVMLSASGVDIMERYLNAQASHGRA